MSVDPIKEGYVKVKSKHLGTWNKRWLKLRPANSKQPNRLEKYQDEASAISSGDRTTYDLTDARYVDRMKATDKKRAVCIVLHNYDVVQFALSSDLEANSWLQDVQRLLFGKTDVSSMFEVYLMKAPSLNNASGECLLQVTEDSVRLLDIDNPRRVQLELPLSTIRRYSTERGILRLETGRSSPIGEGELMFDTTETDEIYNSIRRATKEMVARQNKPQTVPASPTTVEQEVDYRMSSQPQSQKKQTDSRRAPEYEDSPPPYTAPGVPYSSAKVKSSTKSKTINQEYIEPCETGNQYMETSNSVRPARSKSDTTYSSKSTVNKRSEKKCDQFDEELPVYNGVGDGSNDVYVEEHVYDGDRRQTTRTTAGSTRTQTHANSHSRSVTSSNSPYHLETDYRGFSNQGAPPTPPAARGRATGHSQYSVPDKATRHFQQPDHTEPYYDDVIVSRRSDNSESDQNWSAGTISGSYTDRVQASVSVDPTSSAPQVPPRRGGGASFARNSKPTTQISTDWEDQKLDTALSHMVSDTLNLRTSLQVDHYELN